MRLYYDSIGLIDITTITKLQPSPIPTPLKQWDGAKCKQRRVCTIEVIDAKRNTLLLHSYHDNNSTLANILFPIQIVLTGTPSFKKTFLSFLSSDNREPRNRRPNSMSVVFNNPLELYW